MNKIKKKNTNKKMKHKYDENTPIIIAPRIDKISGVVDLEDAGLCGIAYHGMLSWVEDSELGVVKVKPSSNYKLALMIHYHDTNGVIHLKSPALRLEITSSKVAKRQIRFEYNPFYITETGEEHLNTMIAEVLGVTFYELLLYARFTRVDFCMDIADCDIEDYLLHVKYSKYSQCFFGADGKLQSLNFCKSGSNQTLVYNKTKEIHGSADKNSIVRVEVRCRINHTILQLAKFENPFRNINIYSAACKTQPFGNGHWVAFQDSCRLRGVGNAIKKQPVKYRSKLNKVLSEQPVPWWGITSEDWAFLLTSALEDAGLTNIPNYAPPLSLSYHAGYGT